MDIANYYITTLTNAGANILPVILFLGLGYLVFFKLPFSVFLKVLKDNKPGPTTVNPEVAEPPEGTFLGAPESRRPPRDEEKKKKQRKSSRSADSEGPGERRQERPSHRPNPERPRKPSLEEEIFQLAAGQRLTRPQLKRKYHELLKINHPDKVATQGGDARRMAELKTKAINSAYQKLKDKAA